MPSSASLLKGICSMRSSNPIKTASAGWKPCWRNQYFNPSVHKPTSPQGTYTCMAKNTLGETISREARMTIRPASQSEPARPQFVQIPSGHVFFSEDSDFVVMHCVASGVPQPHIQWSFNGHPIHDNTERVQIHDNGTLVIHGPIEEDEGTYRCEASNYLGTISTVANYKISGKLSLEIIIGCGGHSHIMSRIVFWSKTPIGSIWNEDRTPIIIYFDEITKTNLVT